MNDTEIADFWMQMEKDHENGVEISPERLALADLLFEQEKRKVDNANLPGVFAEEEDEEDEDYDLKYSLLNFAEPCPTDLHFGTVKDAKTRDEWERIKTMRANSLEATS